MPKVTEERRARAVSFGFEEPDPNKVFVPKLYCDGGHTAPNPATYGYVIVPSDDRKHDMPFKGIVPANIKQSNNTAEYSSVLNGLRKMLELGYDSVHVYMDSKLVVEQLNGHWQVRDAQLRILHIEVKDTIKLFKEFTIEWIPRNQNIADRYSR